MVNPKLTPSLRAKLSRLAYAGRPLTIDEVRCGGKNAMPKIILAGWAKCCASEDVPLYTITEEGLAALGLSQAQNTTEDPTP